MSWQPGIASKQRLEDLVVKLARTEGGLSISLLCQLLIRIILIIIIMVQRTGRWNDNLDWRSCVSQTSFFLQNASFSLIQPIILHIPGYAFLTVIIEITRQRCSNKLCPFSNEPQVGLSWSRCRCPQVSFRQCKTLRSEIQFYLGFLDALASLKTMFEIH